MKEENIFVEVSLKFEEAIFGKNITCEVQNKKFEVKVPAGIYDGQKLKIKNGVGEGKNILISVKVEAHQIFQRKGNDIYCEVEISSLRAKSGGKIKIPTIYGEKNLKLPANVSDGKIYKIKGVGIKNFCEEIIGDEYVKIKINKNLDEAEKTVQQNFFDRLRKFLK